jgi:hypothetical protein
MSIKLTDTDRRVIMARLVAADIHKLLSQEPVSEGAIVAAAELYTGLLTAEIDLLEGHPTWWVARGGEDVYWVFQIEETGPEQIVSFRYCDAGGGGDTEFLLSDGRLVSDGDEWSVLFNKYGA